MLLALLVLTVLLFRFTKKKNAGKDFEMRYKMALQLLSSQHLSAQNHETEFLVVQNIHKLLAGKERYADIRKFDELHTKLVTSVRAHLKLSIFSFQYLLFVGFFSLS